MNIDNFGSAAESAQRDLESWARWFRAYRDALEREYFEIMTMDPERIKQLSILWLRSRRHKRGKAQPD